MVWEQFVYSEFETRINRWPKKHQRELEAMLANYETVVESLNLGAKVEHIKFGFVHRGPSGIWEIAQNGAGSGTIESRLYVFPERELSALHVMTIGTKRTQPDDIQGCVQIVKSLMVKVGENNGK